jgi:GNAT superfamily N-acetyltransferase
MGKTAEAAGPAGGDRGCMHSTSIETRAGRIIVRALRNGDTATVASVFEALGPESRRLRFGHAKRELKPDELEQLARVDATHHVLVAWLAGRPVGIARLVRDAAGSASGEIAGEVVDSRQGRGIGTALIRLLMNDAAAAGITHVHAILSHGSPSLSVLTKAATIVSRRFAAGQLEVVALTA